MAAFDNFKHFVLVEPEIRVAPRIPSILRAFEETSG
jgi:hypothetical protein